MQETTQNPPSRPKVGENVLAPQQSWQMEVPFQALRNVKSEFLNIYLTFFIVQPTTDLRLKATLRHESTSSMAIPPPTPSFLSFISARDCHQSPPPRSEDVEKGPLEARALSVTAVFFQPVLMEGGTSRQDVWTGGTGGFEGGGREVRRLSVNRAWVLVINGMKQVQTKHHMGIISKIR